MTGFTDPPASPASTSQDTIPKQRSDSSLTTFSFIRQSSYLAYRILNIFILQITALILFPFFLTLKIFYSIAVTFILLGYIVYTFSYAGYHMLTCSRKNITISLTLNGSTYVPVSTTWPSPEENRVTFSIKLFISIQHCVIVITLTLSWYIYDLFWNLFFEN